jgi:hypothetical protein
MYDFFMKFVSLCARYIHGELIWTRYILVLSVFDTQDSRVRLGMCTVFPQKKINVSKNGWNPY